MKTKSGRVLTDAEIDRLAAKAEAGLDLSSWQTHQHVPCWQGVEDGGQGCGPWCCPICQKERDDDTAK